MHAPPIPEFTAFRKLDDFIGVQCYYTSKFPEPLTLVGDTTQIDLQPGSIVTIKQVLQENADFDHPLSKGYKLQMMTVTASAIPRSAPGESRAPMPLLHTLLLLYPTVDNHDQITELQLCPVIALNKARQLWLEKPFTYAGSTIGATDIDPGTQVTVTDVQPASFGPNGVTFDMAFKLPSGQTATKTIAASFLVDLLQPPGP